MRRLLTLALLALSASAYAQNYDSILRLKGMNETVSGLRSTADGEHYTVLEANTVRRYSYVGGEGTTLLPVLADSIRITDYLLSPDEQSVLLASGASRIYRHSYTTNYYLSSPNGVRPVLTGIEGTRDASFSPDGRWIAASGGNDLWLCDAASGEVRRMTTDGAWNRVINGTTDWVYEEEFGFTKAYAFSPDSRRIAYLRFDESRVPVFEMMRYDSTLYNKSYSFKYPKAGGPNSIVELWVYDIPSGRSVRIDTGAQTDQYIPRIGWTPGGKLWFLRLNRLQNHLEVVLCEEDGTQRMVYDERSPRYVERANESTVTFLDDDRFIVREETSTGRMHLYLYSTAKGLLNPITQGPWEVAELVAATPKRLYFLSTEGSPLRRSLYSVSLDGKQIKRLTTSEGFYTIAPSKGFKYYVSTFSNASTPNRVEVCRADGKAVRTLKSSEALRSELASHPRSQREFFTFVTERGDTLNGWMLRPSNFDASKRYPLLLTQYSGPGSQQVQDRWGMDWEDALVDAGYLVVCVDGRGTGFRGEAFKKSTYAQLGALETEDQISAARYMASQPYVDASRIGIYGWSYGGFMALNCAFRGEGLFKMAIAVAPVTSWRYYDSIYTEIYNGLPQENASGYDDNSPIHLADRFDDAKTRLLIIHGTADDNVHFQNTVELTRVLNRYKKRYDMMVYPDQNHSMQPDDTRNVRQKMVDYTIENL